mmetsp:Transcript_78600/g.217303  ORF Transcript_78600/g.217303 Transcript_78600/m.217303 type:complete len:203 (+) Transcript_78600:219-827(+)
MGWPFTRTPLVDFLLTILKAPVLLSRTISAWLREIICGVSRDSSTRSFVSQRPTDVRSRRCTSSGCPLAPATQCLCLRRYQPPLAAPSSARGQPPLAAYSLAGVKKHWVARSAISGCCLAFTGVMGSFRARLGAAAATRAVAPAAPLPAILFAAENFTPSSTARRSLIWRMSSGLTVWKICLYTSSLTLSRRLALPVLEWKV